MEREDHDTLSPKFAVHASSYAPYHENQEVEDAKDEEEDQTDELPPPPPDDETFSHKHDALHQSPSMTLPSSHCSHALVIKIPSPHTAKHVPVVPVPLYQLSQAQVKDHDVLVHVALTSQLSVPKAHSSISTQALPGVGQVYPDSTAQLASHPSPFIALPSSQVSNPVSTFPSPQYPAYIVKEALQSEAQYVHDCQLPYHGSHMTPFVLPSSQTSNPVSISASPQYHHESVIF